MRNRSKALLALCAVAASVASYAQLEPRRPNRPFGFSPLAATLTDCSGQPEGALCDDGNACTLLEKCTLQNCLAPMSHVPAVGSPFMVGTTPLSIAVADFNLNGNLDFAVVNSRGANVSIRLGDGSGGFPTGSEVNVGTDPVFVAAGDWNHDGKPDLAVINTGTATRTISILQGDGSGAFVELTPTIQMGSASFTSIAVGDLNGDGNLDLAVANGQNSGFVAILLGNGSAGFTRTANLPVGDEPWSVVVGDWNEDGRLDLATGNAGSNDISVLLGDGCAGFTPAPGSPLPVSIQPSRVATGDFNGDGHLDFAFAWLAQAKFAIALGNGLGGFSQIAPVYLSVGGHLVVVGDLNGDGKQDVVTGGTTVSALLGNGTGGFSQIADIPSGMGPWAVALADWNNDGKLDIASASVTGNNVTIRLNHTDHAADNTPCNDGNPCTQTSSCQKNACKGASPVVCISSDNCISSACSRTTGQCVETPILPPSGLNNSLRVREDSGQTTIECCFATPATSAALLRGLLSGLPVGSGAGEVCLGVGLPSTPIIFADTATPLPGAGFWYLARGDNACGEGSYGYQAQHGVPTVLRMSGTCP